MRNSHSFLFELVLSCYLVVRCRTVLGYSLFPTLFVFLSYTYTFSLYSFSENTPYFYKKGLKKENSVGNRPPRESRQYKKGDCSPLSSIFLYLHLVVCLDFLFHLSIYPIKYSSIYQFVFSKTFATIFSIYFAYKVCS